MQKYLKLSTVNNLDACLVEYDTSTNKFKVIIKINNVSNNKWFFDTELIIMARSENLKIDQIPVVWVDDPNTSVNILTTAIEDLIGLIKLRLKLFKKIV